MNKMETSPGINSKLAESLEVNETTLPSTRISMVTDPVKINEESSPGCDRDNSAQKQNEEVSSDEYPQGFRLACIVTALALTIFLGSLDMTIVATAIPKITDRFNSLTDVAWYGSAYFITLGATQPAWGKVYKYFPLKLSYLASIFLFELGSLICATAPSSKALIVGRAIAGIGGSGISTGSYIIIAFSTEPKKRPLYTGIIGMAFGIASVTGPLLGGVLTSHVSWQWCFYINLPIGGFSAVVITIFFHPLSTARAERSTFKEKLLQMDLVGILLAMGTILSFILALQYGGQTHPWGSGTVIGLLVGFIAIGVLFVIWEYLQDERAMIPRRLITQRVYLVEALCYPFILGPYYLVVYYLPIYFQSIDNASPVSSGVRNLPLIISFTIATIISGGIITFTGYATPIKIVGAAIAVIGSGLLYNLEIDTKTGEWIGYQIVGGFGWGLIAQIPIITVQATASPKDMATTTAIMLFTSSVGGAFIISAGQAAFINVMSKVVPGYAPGIDPAAVIVTGATDIRDVFPAEMIPGILHAYMRGMKIAFAICLASSALGFITCLATKFRRLNMDAMKSGGNTMA